MQLSKIIKDKIMINSNFKYHFYTIENFINLVKQRLERSKNFDSEYFYAIYVKKDGFSLGQTILVSDPVFVSDDDTEIYPNDVIAHQLNYQCSDENIQDVIDLAIQQKPSATDQELIQALNYYLERDNFLDL